MQMPSVLSRPSPLTLPSALPRRLLADGRLRRWALVTLALAALSLGGWLWLRSSSLVAVRQVRIVGVEGPQAAQIETALRQAAKGMTTLRFDQAALLSAVRDFPAVERVRATTGFPHDVRIVVVERRAVAMLAANGQRTAVAADGTVLGSALLSSALPLVHGAVVPPTGSRVSEGSVVAAVAVLGAAPSRLVRFVARVYEGPEGLTVAMRNGLLVYFGDATRPHAKWLALAGVLADPSSAGATYVDVRVPGRPAAGKGSDGLSRSTLSGSSSSTKDGEAAAAALAERLAGTVGGGALAAQPATGTATGAESESATEGAQEAAPAEHASSAAPSAQAPSAEASSPEGASTQASSPEEATAGGAHAP